MEAFEVKRVPYFDIEDTILEADITRRQLSHWEDQGLLTPDLGIGSNKYTTTDIRRLKALRRLIVDLKMPIALVKEFVDGAGDNRAIEFATMIIETSRLFGSKTDAATDLIYDFQSQSFRTKSDLLRDTYCSTFAKVSESHLEDTVYDLTLLLFRVVKERLKTPAAFAERTDEILAELNFLPNMARVELFSFGDSPDDLAVYRFPKIEGDTDLDKDHLWKWFPKRASRLSKFRDALEPNSPYLSRFWTKGDIELAQSTNPYTRARLEKEREATQDDRTNRPDDGSEKGKSPDDETSTISEDS